MKLLYKKMKVFSIHTFFIYSVLCAFHFFIQADNEKYCRLTIQDLQSEESIQGTRLGAEIKALETIRSTKPPYPTHTNLEHDQTLPLLWDKKPDMPSLFQAMLPPGVQFINHQQEYSNHPVHVQLEAPGHEAAMFRAQWSLDGKHYSANVLSSTAPLYDNLMNAYENRTTEKYLAGTNDRIVFIDVRGGGSRSVTPASSFEKANTMGHYGIDVLSISHPLHGEGPQQMMSVREFWYMMNAFVTRYVHPDADIYVGGHSLGGSLTAVLMEMWHREHTINPSFFPQLKGTLIASPAMDPAPGKPIAEKVEIFLEQERLARKLSNEEGSDGNLWVNDLIIEGKLGFLEEIWTVMSIFQQNQVIPDHRGKYYPPTFVVTAKKDPLVSLTRERRKQILTYFRALENVKLFYLIKERPVVVSSDTLLREPGHILGDFKYGISGEISTNSEIQMHPKPGFPIDIYIALKLIERVSKQPLSELVERQQQISNQRHTLVWNLAKMAQQSSNDFGIRHWLETFETRITETVRQELSGVHDQMDNLVKKANELVVHHFPYNLFADEIRFLSKVETSQQLKAGLERLKRLQPFIESHSILRNYQDILSSIDSPETARSTARHIAKQIFLKPSIYKGASPEDLKTMFASGSRKELSDFLNQFPYTNSESNQPFFIPDNIKNEVLVLYDEFQTKTHAKPKNIILKNARHFIAQYHPYFILFKTLETLSNKPMPNNLTEYFSSIQPFYDYFQATDLYKPLVSLLSKLLSAKNNEDILSLSQEIIGKYASFGPLSTRSHNTKMLSVNQQTTKEEFFNMLDPFGFSEQDTDQIWDKSMKSLKDQQSKEFFISPLIVERAPVNKLNQLLDILREMTIQNTLKELKEYFTFHNIEESLVAVIDQILQSPTSEQRKAIAYKFMESYYFQWTHTQHKEVVKMLRVFSGKLSLTNLQTLEKSSYFDETKKSILDHYREYHKLAQYTEGFHVPSLEDFYNYQNKASKSKKRSFSKTPENDRRFSKSIENIEENVRQKKEVSAQLKRFERDRAKLVQEIMDLTNTVRSNIRTVTQALSQFHIQQPPSLVEAYQKIDESIIQPLLKVSEQEIAGYLVTFGQPFLENLSLFDNQNVIKAMVDDSKFQELIKKYEELQAQWKQAERDLHPQMLKAMITGEMGEEVRVAAVALYGPTGTALVKDSLYKQLEIQISKLAQIESKIIRIEEQWAHLQLEYHRIYPAPVSSVIIPIQPQEILNPEFSSNRDMRTHIDRYRLEIETLYNIWNKMRGTLPLTLPIDPLTSPL